MKLKKLKIIIILVFIFINTNIAIGSNFFIDVFGHWAEEEILYVTNDIPLFIGYKDGTFRPDKNISRSEFITILYRAAVSQDVIEEIINSKTNNKMIKFEDENKIVNDVTDKELKLDSSQEEVNNSTIINKNLQSDIDEVELNKDNKSQQKNINEFEQNNNGELSVYEDIDSSFWGYDYINCVANYINNKTNQITFQDIFSGNKFKPNKQITREETVLLTSFFTTPPLEKKSLNFKDINFDYKYYNEILNLYSNNIINGYPDNTFRPNNSITRAEAATIIKRIYFDMEYLKKDYLKDIELINDIFDSKFMLFGDYSSDESLNSEDIMYKKAIITLEYKSLVKTIPYEEQHLYDLNPIKTIKELKESGYWNVLGLNYYLLKYNAIDKEDIQKSVDLILLDYINRDDINGIESKLIFRNVIKNSYEGDLLLSAIDKWYSVAQGEKDKLNAIFMKCRTYINKGNYDNALKSIRNIKIEHELAVKNQIHLAFNKAYILLKLKEYDRAEKILKNVWCDIQSDDDYNLKREEYDKEFIGALKQIKIEKQIYINRNNSLKNEKKNKN